MTPSGYLHPNYAASFAEFGRPRYLPASGGWILERDIPGTSAKDAMGMYPILCCSDWARFPEDLEALEGDLVTLSFVTDPMANIEIDKLRGHLDVCVKFKDHYVTDLSAPLDQSVSSRHRYKARRALKDVMVERCDSPIQYHGEWVALYSNLIRRHNITGLRAFSSEHFEQLLTTSGLEMFVARDSGEVVGGMIWLTNGDIAFDHLTAVSERGYQLSASYALRWAAMVDFSQRCAWVSHGGTAGVDQLSDGLTEFKKGWATGSRPAYFCGRILNREAYDKLADSSHEQAVDYFPVYRAGEFG